MGVDGDAERGADLQPDRYYLLSDAGSFFFEPAGDNEGFESAEAGPWVGQLDPGPAKPAACDNPCVASPVHPPERGSLARWGTRADVVISSTRREFVYRWTTPRSPALRVVLAPVFLAAVLVTLVIGFLAFALALALAVVAVVVIGLVGLLWSIAARLGLHRR